MSAVRLSVTLPLEKPPASLEAAIGVFHRFVQQGVVEGLLIDVADYQHVPDGPGVLLIGHDVDYSLNETGLTAIRKRQGDVDPADQLRDTLRLALAFQAAVDDDGTLGLSYVSDALDVQVMDRLQMPNTDEGVANARAAFAPVIEDVFGSGASFDGVAGDARGPIRFALRGPIDRDAALAKLPAGPKLQIPYAAPQSDWDITAEQLKEIRDGDSELLLVDVREADEYEKVNLGGQLVPLATVADKIPELPQDAHVVVHCKVGGRGGQAVKQLRDAGFENAWNLRGGILAWIDRIDPSLPRY